MIFCQDSLKDDGDSTIDKTRDITHGDSSDKTRDITRPSLHTQRRTGKSVIINIIDQGLEHGDFLFNLCFIYQSIDRWDGVMWPADLCNTLIYLYYY